MINPLDYDHLAYIATSYGLFAAATFYVAFGTRARIALVSRRLRAADPRAPRPER